jgi:hypothetical protein
MLSDLLEMDVALALLLEFALECLCLHLLCLFLHLLFHSRHKLARWYSASRGPRKIEFEAALLAYIV